MHPVFFGFLGQAFAWVALLCCGTAAMAQPQPYDPVTVSYDQTAAGDEALKMLIGKLHLAVAEKKLGIIDAALGPGLQVIDCDNDPAKACTPALKGALRSNPRIAPPLRLRAALCCRDIAPAKITKILREETVLGLIGAALEEETLGTHPALPGLACLPAWPLFDAGKATAMAVAADVERANLRVAMIEIVLREKPEPEAPVKIRIAQGQMVPLVTELAETLPAGWTAIAMPQGGLGYTDQLGLNEIAPGGLCFGKNPAGEWQIMLSIQRRS